jgi:hypothetical protein
MDKVATERQIFIDRVKTSFMFNMLAEDVQRIVTGMAEEFYDTGWQVNEAISFISLMEEIDPDLEEDFACNRMEDIRSAVAERKMREGVK